MEQNKVRSYLLYALGEILLVVIGILIALQINNWNDERKLRAYTETQLISLKDQLLKEQELLNYVRYLHAFRYNGIQRVLTFANLDTVGVPTGIYDFKLAFEPFQFWDEPIPGNYNRAFVDAVFSWTNRFVPFDSNRNILFEVERSGGFSTITDPDLKYSIQRYFELIDFHFSEDAQRNSESIERWNEILLEEGYLSLNPEQIDAPLSLLKKDKELAATFRDIGMGAMWFGDGVSTVLKSNQELVDQINRELRL